MAAKYNFDGLISSLKEIYFKTSGIFNNFFILFLVLHQLSNVPPGFVRQTLTVSSRHQMVD